jgi:thiol-disulfide isomerase/thioredoxin
MNYKTAQTLIGLAGLILILGTASPALAILQKGQPAPPIKVTTTSGQPVTMANYKGYVVIVDFFATWCGPCKEAIPHLNSLNKKYANQGLQLLGLSVDDGGEKLVRDFSAARQLSYPVAIADDDLQTEYGLRSVPTLFVINKKGVVAEKYQGFSAETAKAIEVLVKKLLAE